MALKVSTTLLPKNIKEINIVSDDDSPYKQSKDSSIDLEEKKHYDQRKSVVQRTSFDGSDNEAY